MKHSKSALLHAIKAAGSQLELAIILDVNPSQISQWLHNDQVNMPIKYADKIETWTDGQITKKNLFPGLKTISITNKQMSALNQVEMLISAAKQENLTVNIHISLDIPKAPILQPNMLVATH